MFPNYLGLISALIALVLFAFAHRRGIRLPPRSRRRWLLASALLSLPALYNAVCYLHLTPETVWFYQTRSWPGIELLVIPAGIGGGLLAASLPRRLLVLPLLATTGITGGPFLKPVLAPVRTELRDTWVRDVCIQSSLSTCGPASTATILRHLGLNRGEPQIARAAHSYLGGTEAWYLARYVRNQGATARFLLQSPAGFPEHAVLPAIVGVTVEKRGHFIAILSRDGDWFFVGDPMVGPERMTRKMLEVRYGFTGFALQINRG